MIVSSLVVGEHGFDIYRDDVKSKWSISIESTVKMERRANRNAYHILIKENSVVGASLVFAGGNTQIRLKKDNYVVPAYVKDMAIDILENGNLNKYVKGEKIDNDFTNMKSAKEYS